jgi:serine/threonine protein kinase
MFKNFEEIFNKQIRVIEFGKKKSILSDLLSTHHKYLTILKSGNINQNKNQYIIQNPEKFLQAIRRNSTDVIILNSVGFRELKALYNTSEATHTFQRISIFNFILIIYKLVKHLVLKRFWFDGIYLYKKGIKTFFYLCLRRNNPGKKTRHFLSPIIKLEDFFQKLNDNKIKYCVLRWFDTLPEVQADEDIDLLVDDDDLEKLHSLIDELPGIIPFDIYSKSGKPGSDFYSLPYQTIALSTKVLEETILYKNKFKVPTPENYFYLLAYHVVFHKGENSGLPCRMFNLKINEKPDHNYYKHLQQISIDAKLSVPDLSLEGLHSFLEQKGFAPPVDTIFKLSVNNVYLQHYLKKYQTESDEFKKFQGLVCFVAREKIVEKNLLDDLIKHIQKAGFTVLRIKSLEEPFKSNFTSQVRGGNWNQGPWPVSGGLPSVVLVALDVYPVEPNPSDFVQHPGLTNRRLIYKNEIRDFINLQLTDESEWFNGVHSSDNEIMALEYLSLAGMDKNEIYDEIINLRKSFVTKFQVLNELSQYSKRAKVELIDYNGVKAVKKTFKPNCENFLQNEITAYKLFSNKIPIPELLESGNNYIITSYIEGSRTFGNRIKLKELKECLRIIRQVYDAGYSLIDFKPENFLIDKNNKIYLTDFEFLHKYEVKPLFLESFDLVGPPKNIDISLLPNYHIPKGTKQFDVLWYNSTGVTHSELSQLDNFSLRLKSVFRNYSFRSKNKISKIFALSKQTIKKFIKHLP